MYHMLLYDVVENFSERRAVFREAHLTLVQAAHERGELIRDRAARNGFVGLMLAAAAVGVYATLAGLSDVPSSVMSGLVLLGVLVYFASDRWLRRRT